MNMKEEAERKIAPRSNKRIIMIVIKNETVNRKIGQKKKHII